MRIDKFLKASRIIKRRTVAQNACGGERVFLNGRAAKPGAQVKAGDEIAIQFGERTVRVRVLKTEEPVRKEQADEMYEVLP